jgi:hypothetical protein
VVPHQEPADSLWLRLPVPERLDDVQEHGKPERKRDR